MTLIETITDLLEVSSVHRKLHNTINFHNMHAQAARKSGDNDLADSHERQRDDAIKDLEDLKQNRNKFK